MQRIWKGRKGEERRGDDSWKINQIMFCIESFVYSLFSSFHHLSSSLLFNICPILFFSTSVLFSSFHLHHLSYSLLFIFIICPILFFSSSVLFSTFLFFILFIYIYRIAAAITMKWQDEDYRAKISSPPTDEVKAR